MGYLKSLGNKRYRIMYDVPPTDGRKRQQKTETLVNKTKKEAEAILAKREEAVSNGTYVKDDDMALSRLFASFMDKKKARIEATTFARYKSLFNNHLVPAFGNMKVKELRQGHLVDTYAKWLDTGSNGRRISAKTIRHAHEVLRNALNWAVRMEYVTRNVATLISADDLPKAPAPKPKALTETELSRLLLEAKNPQGARRSVGISRRGRGSIQPCSSRLSPAAGVAKFLLCVGLTST